MAVIDFQLVCLNCGGRLVRAELDGACPGCLAPVHDSIYLHAFDAEKMAVNTGIKCIECRYSLRTLPVGSACPECGIPVANSLRADLLRFADPNWLAQILRGTHVLIAVLIGEPCVFLAMMMISNWGGGSGAQMAFMLLAFFAFVGAASFVFGSLAVASRESKRRRSFNLADPHSLVLLMLLCVSLAPLALLASATRGSLGIIGPMIATTIGSVATIGFTVGLVCMPICLRRIAYRARRRDLRKIAGLLIWLTTGTCVGIVCSFVLALASVSLFGSSGRRSTFVDSLISILMTLSGAGALVVSLLLLYFLVSLRSILCNIRNSPLSR